MAEKKEFIRIRGARENNLKALNVDIPRNQFVVFTGLSGSGKSSLAFDTIYAEGQRRYMESLSSYARQFLGQMEKPNVDSIEGLPPAISIDQKSTNRNPRSTVGTVTEIYDYFRLLYARIGIPHCPKCGRAIEKQTIDQMVDAVMKLPEPDSPVRTTNSSLGMSTSMHFKLCSLAPRILIYFLCFFGILFPLLYLFLNIPKHIFQFYHLVTILCRRLKIEFCGSFLHLLLDVPDQFF